MVHQEDGSPPMARAEAPLVGAEPLPPREEELAEAGQEAAAASDSGKASSEDKSNKSDDAASAETSAENSPRQREEGQETAAEVGLAPASDEPAAEDYPLGEAPSLEDDSETVAASDSAAPATGVASEAAHDTEQGGAAPESRAQGTKAAKKTLDSKARSRERRGRVSVKSSSKDANRDASQEGGTGSTDRGRGRGRGRGAGAVAGRRQAGRHNRPANRLQDHDEDVGGTGVGGVVNGDDIETVMGADSLRLKAAEAGAEEEDEAPGDEEDAGSEPSTGRSHNNDQLVDSGLEPSPRREKPAKDAASADSSPSRRRAGRAGRRRDRPGSAGDTEEGTVSVTRAVQLSMRKYHLERRIFHELLELKRLQIRAGRANEQVLVKRLVDDYRRAGLSVGLQPFSGTYTFRSFEKYLYDQLRALQSDNRRVVPRLQSSDDLEKLTAALRRTRQAPHHPAADNPLQCTSSTHRCHHAVHAYSGVPCAAYIPKLNHHYMPKDGLYSGFLPHIDGASARPSLSSRTAPVTLELSHGPDKQVISLPTEHLDKNKRYYVTFTIKGGPQGQAHSAAPATEAPADPAPPATPHLASGGIQRPGAGAGAGAGAAGAGAATHAKSF